MTIEHPTVGTRVELTIKDRDGSTSKISGTIRREDAYALGTKLMADFNDYRKARAKATLEVV